MTYLIPSMVCSEPLISEDAPPQWKCICRAMYSVPSAAVILMVGGRLICTGRADEGQVGAGEHGRVRPPCEAASLAPCPLLRQAGAADRLRMSRAGSPVGGGTQHTGRDRAQALSKLGWAGASPRAHTFPPKPEAQGQDHGVAGQGGGPENIGLVSVETRTALATSGPFGMRPQQRNSKRGLWDSFACFYSPEQVLFVRPS